MGRAQYRGFLLFSQYAFLKEPTTIDEQIELLLTRGMVIDDVVDAENWLKSISYYRFSAYWLPFEKPIDDKIRSKVFQDNITFKKVRDLYIFDRKLRLLLLEAIERIEVHVCSRWTYYMVHSYGPHAYLDQSLFSNTATYAEQLSRLA